MSPQTDAEWARQTEQRLRALEAKSTVRIGEWVITASDDGNLVAVKPGAANLDVGQTPTEAVVADLTRGYVSESAVTNALTGSPSGGMASVATTTVARDDKTQGILNTAVSGLRGWVVPLPEDQTLDDSQRVHYGTARTLAYATSWIATQQGFTKFIDLTGSWDLVNFVEVPDYDGMPDPPWEVHHVGGSGHFRVLDGSMSWKVAGIFDSYEYIQHTTLVTNTDFQIVGSSALTAPQDLFGLNRAWNYVIGRGASDFSEFALLALSSNELLFMQAEWDGVSAYDLTLIDTTSHTFNASATYWLACGVGGVETTYQVYENDTLLDTYYDTGGIIQYGAGYRTTGIGGQALQNLTGSSSPGKVLAFVAGDSVL